MVDRGGKNARSMSNQSNDENHRFDYMNYVNRMQSLAPRQESRMLPEDYQPDNWTVICGRGRAPYDHSKFSPNTCLVQACAAHI